MRFAAAKHAAAAFSGRHIVQMTYTRAYFCWPYENNKISRAMQAMMMTAITRHFSILYHMLPSARD